MWLKKLFAKFIPAEKAEPASPAPAPRAEPPASAPEPKEFCPRPDFHDPVYLALAGLCALGDIAAMWELARWHRSHLRASTEELLAAYEAGADTYGQLWQRCRYPSPPDCLSLQAYLTWIGQAARYGHPEAQKIVADRKLFKYAGLLSQKTVQVGGISSELHSSLELNRLGMTDVDDRMYEFGLYPLTQTGVYMAYYQSDYYPADSDGFGREEEYENLFYDEFFCLLSARNLSGAEQLAAENRQRREEYWSDPAHGPDNRKYRQLWSEMPLEPEIQEFRKHLTIAPPEPPEVYASRPDYCDPVHKALTRLCALGDITAMWDLAHWHRKCLSPEAARLLTAYERAGDGYEALCATCLPDSQDGKSLDAYVTWLCRAARYGNEQAVGRIRGLELFRARGTLPPCVYQVGTNQTAQARSRDLHDLGIPGASQFNDPTDVFAISVAGVYVFFRKTSYASIPDEQLYFDEFFCLLHAQTPEEAAEQARKNHLRRESYWADPAHSPETRKYRSLLCGFGTIEE